MDGLPARTGVRLLSKQCQRWHPLKNVKICISAVGSDSRKEGGGATQWHSSPCWS